MTSELIEKSVVNTFVKCTKPDCEEELIFITHTSTRNTWDTEWQGKGRGIKLYSFGSTHMQEFCIHCKQTQSWLGKSHSMHQHPLLLISHHNKEDKIAEQTDLGMFSSLHQCSNPSNCIVATFFLLCYPTHSCYTFFVVQLFWKH